MIKKLFLSFCFVLVQFVVSAQTNTYTGNSGGNWNTPSNWSLGIVPVAAHDVIVPDAKNVTVDAPFAACKTLTISTGSNNNNVSVGVNTLSITGALTINIPNVNNINKIVSVTSGILNCGSVVMGNSGGNSRDCRVTVTSGTINVFGNIMMGGNSNENQLLLDGTTGGTGTTGGILNIGGNFTGTGGDIVPGKFSTVNYNGTSAQIIAVNGNFQYNNLLINNVAGATLQAKITNSKVLGNITVQTGLFNNGGFDIVGNVAKTFTIANGATFILEGTTDFPTVFGTNTLAATSTVEYNGTGAQNIFDITSPGYGNLILSPGGTKTATGGLDIQGNVTVNSGATFAASTFTHNITGNLSNSGTVSVTTGTINLTGNWINSGSFMGGTTSTVNLNANLTNSGIFTAGAGLSNINIKGNWSNIGTFTCGNTGTITFNSTATTKTITGTISGVLGKFNNLTFNGIGGQWTISNNLDVANKLTVSNGKVNVSGIVTVSGNVPVTVSAGTLIFEDGSSLMQTGFTGANVGNITYKRITSTPIDNFDYTYWSSPVSPQKLIDVSPNTSLDKFFSFNLATYDWQQENSTTNMISGIGYIIRGPQNFVAPAPPNFYQAPFIGVPNNGVVTVTITPTPIASESSALIGNPYPSALDADLFLIANMTTALEGTLYLWTHNTNIGEGIANLGSGAYAYTSDDYATYNLTGGVGTGVGTLAAGINNSVPNGKIASGQAFFAGVKPAGGIVTFNNSMRIGGAILDNSYFFKLNNTKSKENSSIEKDRVWLNLYNSQGAFKQALIGYITGATNEYDNGYDGGTFDGNEFVDFYSVNQDKNLVIQGRALPFDESDEVPLGYKTTIVGDFTIDIAQADGLLATKNIFIEDKSTQTVKNLREGAYKFTTEAGTFNDRFVLRYTNKTLGTDNFEKPENTIFISNKNKQIKINSSVGMIDKIQVYDLLGRSIYQKMNLNTTEFVISNLILSNQILLVKIKLDNGQTVTRKVVY